MHQHGNLNWVDLHKMGQCTSDWDVLGDNIWGIALRFSLFRRPPKAGSTNLNRSDLLSY